MNQFLKSKGTALITGGACRIGRAIALYLSSVGYTIALHYHSSQADAEKTATQIHKNAGECSLFRCDLTHEKNTRMLIGKIHKKHKDLNLLINNASIFLPSSFKKNSCAILKNLQIHLIAPYILSQEFNTYCKKGEIINILDTHVSQNNTRYFDYLLSKKALLELTKMSAVALAPNIRVNGIAPGLILAPKNKGNDHLNRLAKHIPLKRKGNTEHITKSIQYLLDNSYVTGQILFNDGGEHLL